MMEKIGPGRPLAPPGTAGAEKAPRESAEASVSFRRILEEARPDREVVFSAHALNRLAQRQIKLGREDLRKITEAMDRVAAKGARSPLLLYNDIALLASVPNRTIITAVDGTVEEEQIYTHIDSAVIFR